MKLQMKHYIVESSEEVTLLNISVWNRSITFLLAKAIDDRLSMVLGPFY